MLEISLCHHAPDQSVSGKAFSEIFFLYQDIRSKIEQWGTGLLKFFFPEYLKTFSLCSLETAEEGIGI